MLHASVELVQEILRGRDAVHAATALEHGLVTIISPDPDFDGAPGLTRIEPAALS